MSRYRLSSRWAKRIQDDDANMLVEFALIANALLLLFLATVDLSRVFYYQTAVDTAARVSVEAAMNPCSYQTSCSMGATPQPDSVIMWSAYCSGQPELTLAPSFTSCPPCSAQTCTAPCSSPCASCSQDICVSPSDPQAGQTVTVSVGFAFRPVEFLLDQFFPARSCFTGDSPSVNHHTLCATSTGPVG